MQFTKGTKAMRLSRMTSILVGGLGSFLTVGVVYAVCVTPQQLMTKIDGIITSATTFTSEADFVYASLKDLSQAVGISLKGMDPTLGTNAAVTPTALLTGLQARPDDWQRVEAVNLAASPTSDESNLLQSNLTKVQKWASYGELVIAIDGVHIGIVYPAPAADAANTTWTGFNNVKFKVPPIAISTIPTGSTSAPAKKDTLDTVFNPRTTQFFRYKN